MASPEDDDSSDPRPPPSDAAPVVDSAGQLRDADAAATVSPPVIVGSAVLIPLVLTFGWWLAHHRPHASNGHPAVLASARAIPPAPPPPADLLAFVQRPATPPLAPASATPVVGSPPAAGTGSPAVAPVNPILGPRQPMIVAAQPAAPSPLGPTFLTGEQNAKGETSQGRGPRSPVLIVDFTDGSAAPAAADAKSSDKNTDKAASAPAPPAPALNGDESFAARTELSQAPRSRASSLRNAFSTVPQGAMIPAVLETALNSDLPGFTRAVVSRDVRSFDGSKVLIPRGSRAIGEYRSGVALGASRAFVIWTRILRPDGASIQIGSSGADALGRAGLEGRVDRHFFERFGGALLLSVVNLGQAALTGGNNTQIVVGSSSQAGSLASAASAFAPQSISPTIKVAQGTPIRIFVARDLDFSPVEPQP